MGLKPASAEFPKLEHLEGCLVIVQGHELGTSPSTVKGAKEGATYDWVTATVAILDGEPDAEKIDTDGGLPVVLEDMRLSGAGLVPQLRSKVGKYDSDGTPKLSVGRVVRFKNSFNHDRSFKLDAPSEYDMRAAIEYVTENPDTFPDRDPFSEDSAAARAFA
jgi:hypothetical protein